MSRSKPGGLFGPLWVVNEVWVACFPTEASASAAQVTSFMRSLHEPERHKEHGMLITYWKNTNGDGTNGDGTFSDLRSQRAHSKMLLLSRYGPDEPKTKKVLSPFVPSPFVEQFPDHPNP